MLFNAFRIYIYTFAFFVITFLFFIAGIYLDVSLNEALEQQNSELASERMENVENDLLSNFNMVRDHAEKLSFFIENNPESKQSELKSFVELNLLPKDLSSFFNAVNNDFINGYIIALGDSPLVISKDDTQTSFQLNDLDKSTEYYLDLTKRNPGEVVVQGPIISPRTHEINVYNRKAIYVDGKYWGYIGVVVDFYKLLDCMKLNAEDSMFIYSIKSPIYKADRDFIWGDSSLFNHKNVVYRQRTIVFGKQHWDFALKEKNVGKPALLGNKIYFVLFILYLFTLALSYYLVKVHSDLKKAQEIDPITATIGHDKFLAYVKSRIRGSSDHGIVVLELIHFNQINSCYDFKVGDALLCEVTKRIKSVISYNDVVCRIGSEFIIFMKNIRSNIDVDRVQAELYDEMEKAFNVANVCINLKVVIGSSSTISKGRDYYEIMNEISESILETKRSMKFYSRESDLNH
ncbi:diguanylate cyclase (GGDEF) domain-containing protein [Succinivibrio dextrinosolvens DSM 3072]|uniref:Diguanylate cyclase (GGDEF) domain-containing protein n=1 Tax=Succinivibrio dextrinosolvens DSM 3072 TaxID=1123324 RepID=A0A1T4VCE8_9GAMM|nr:diguanylate cyclase (GGDEF) domain-containing protein [Succinivibrio dextrinosolvens DSM 3072]